MTDEELRTKQEIKRKAQHEAWKRWYYGPKGIEYRHKQKQKRAFADDKTS